MEQTLAKRGYLVLYGLGTGVLWVHLWHAVPSALQTLGLVRPKSSPFVRRAGRAVISLICIGFLTILAVVAGR